MCHFRMQVFLSAEHHRMDFGKESPGPSVYSHKSSVGKQPTSKRPVSNCIQVTITTSMAALMVDVRENGPDMTIKCIHAALHGLARQRDMGH